MVNKARSLCGLSWADGHSSGRTVVLPTPVSSLLNVFTPGIFSANFLLLLGSARRKIDKQGNNADLTLGKMPQLLHRCFMQFAQVKQPAAAGSATGHAAHAAALQALHPARPAGMAARACLAGCTVCRASPRTDHEAERARREATEGTARGVFTHVKSFWMLKCARISSGVLPLIMSATVLQVRSSSVLMFK